MFNKTATRYVLIVSVGSAVAAATGLTQMLAFR
jgi:hypothetical protein